MLGVQKLSDTPDNEREYAERMVKMRTLGNIRLVAELYKKGVVQEKIIQFVMQELTGDGRQEPLEDNIEVRMNSFRHLHHCEGSARMGCTSALSTLQRYVRAYCWDQHVQFGISALSVFVVLYFGDSNQTC